nr:heat shock protein 70 family [Tanacetum cinerariifolium]
MCLSATLYKTCHSLGGVFGMKDQRIHSIAMPMIKAFLLECQLKLVIHVLLNRIRVVKRGSASVSTQNQKLSSVTIQCLEAEQWFNCYQQEESSKIIDPIQWSSVMKKAIDRFERLASTTCSLIEATLV